MTDHKELIIVGGAGRNVGKTEFVCRLIEKFSGSHTIYGLKVSAIYPAELQHHGHHHKDEAYGSLYRETCREGNKDTARMLRAGAKEVYYLRDDGDRIGAGYAALRRLLPEDALVVCESNSLADAVRPALHLMIRGADGAVKPRAVAQLNRADLVIVSVGHSGFPELGRIAIVDGAWRLIDEGEER